MAEPALRADPLPLQARVQAPSQASSQTSPQAPPGAPAASRRAAGGEVLLVLRSSLFAVAFYAVIVALMVFGLPLLLGPRRGVIALARLWAGVSLWLLRVICGTRVEFRGLEHRPRGAAILAIKHQSFLETFALFAGLGDFSYVLKRELIAIPLFGWYLRRSGQIAVERERHAGALPALQRAVAGALAQGRGVVIFPEGTRQPVGAAPAYKPGVALLCKAGQRAARPAGRGEAGGTDPTGAGVPCTPVALNTGLFWPRRGWKRRPGRVVIEFLPPLPTSLGKRDFMAAVQRAIEEASDALVAEALAADPGLAAAVRADQPAVQHPTSG